MFLTTSQTSPAYSFQSSMSGMPHTVWSVLLQTPFANKLIFFVLLVIVRIYLLTHHFYFRTLLIKLVSAPQRLHMGMRAGGYFIIINYYFMASLNLVKIANAILNQETDKRDIRLIRETNS